MMKTSTFFSIALVRMLKPILLLIYNFLGKVAFLKCEGFSQRGGNPNLPLKSADNAADLSETS